MRPTHYVQKRGWVFLVRWVNYTDYSNNVSGWEVEGHQRKVPSNLKAVGTNSDLDRSIDKYVQYSMDDKLRKAWKK